MPFLLRLFDGPGSRHLARAGRRPEFLRVAQHVGTHRFRTLAGPADEPSPFEAVYAYRFVTDVTTGNGVEACYGYLSPQPPADSLATRAAWQHWVDEFCDAYVKPVTVYLSPECE